MLDTRIEAHQQAIFDTLRVHCQQGGLCLVLGEPGTDKTVLKEALKTFDPKRLITPTVSRTLHTYFNTIKILSEAFQIDFEGCAFRCEKRLIEQAFKLNHLGKMLAPIIDDAHLMDINCLRKLRLLFEDFPKNHNLIHIGQPTLLSSISLATHEDIKSRVTYSVVMPKIAPDDMQAWILSELDKAGLGHNTITQDALALIVRSAEGLIRHGNKRLWKRNKLKTNENSARNMMAISPLDLDQHEFDRSGPEGYLPDASRRLLYLLGFSSFLNGPNF